MRWFLTVLLILHFVSEGSAGARAHPVFVSTEWLAAHLQDSGLVLLHVSFSRGEYSNGHIPGARFLWYNWLAISTPDASTEMPSLTQADSVLEMLGVSDRSNIVLCFSGGAITTTTRMFLALSYFGLGEQTSILDGGLDAWKAEKRPLSTKAPDVKRASVILRQQPLEIVDANWMKDHLRDSGVVVIDARDKQFYEGNGGGISRTGRISGATNIPFGALVDSTNKVKSAEMVMQLLHQAGIGQGNKLVSYCHVGQQATLIYALGKQLGFETAVYDGSFQEWNLLGPEYPVERPEISKR